MLTLAIGFLTFHFSLKLAVF